jgi:hypothetical protein
MIVDSSEQHLSVSIHYHENPLAEGDDILAGFPQGGSGTLLVIHRFWLRMAGPHTARHAEPMDKYIPPGYGALLEAQSGIIARRQAPADGATMRNRVKDGRWQRPYRAVYAAFSGELDREARLWAALRRAGEGATLSHQTAAERHRLIDEPRPGDPAPTIHITVPATRRPAQLAKIPGVVIHRSHTIFRTRHPVMAPPCTRVEDRFWTSSRPRRASMRPTTGSVVR